MEDEMVQQDKETFLRALARNVREAYAQGRYSEALEVCQTALSVAPDLAQPHVDAAACNVKLERWDQAIASALAALERGSNSLGAYDALAHAWGAKGMAEQARHWGGKALAARAQMFTRAPLLPWDASSLTLPPAPGVQTADFNVIAFSLFGDRSKYCEPAVINALEQQRVYPGWRCHFYVDGSVPVAVLQRLRGAGAVIHDVTGTPVARWPGTMWRFAAYDLPGIHRVLFRDADSVVSEREAAAVAEWIASDRRFHHMRDHGSHTELLLAGLWGAVAHAMPPMATLVDHYLQRHPAHHHFADQFFLREMVWPYACSSLMQHDALFDFFDARPFPGAAPGVREYVGYSEGSPQFNMRVNFPDGAQAVWELCDMSHGGSVICRYPAAVKNSAVIDHLPARYAKQLETGAYQLRVAQRSS